MKMVFRWFGEENDTVTLKQIRQIPGVVGIVWALSAAAGEIWPDEEIYHYKSLIEGYGFNIDVVESLNVHEDIKLGLPSGEEYIENYKKNIEKLGKAGVRVICYNFMPVFDWIRTEFAHPLPDGSAGMFYESSRINDIDPHRLVTIFSKSAKDFILPGWDMERLKHLQKLVEAYSNITEDDLLHNLKQFLEQIMPVCEKYDVKMAIHPDDPPWSLFGLPRIVRTKEHLRRILALTESKYNGLALCSGSLGANPDNNIPEMIREFGDRIYFAHIRNIKRYDNGDFIECSHRASDGSLDIVDIVQAYSDIEFSGYVRPDHGRQIWDENSRPGYGLYDRALGIMYILGIWDHCEKVRMVKNNCNK
jgi:mannonate dehydratase